MKDETRYKFYTEAHKGLTDDLNHISDDLLKAKWFFLASIAALGTAYLKICDSGCLAVDQKMWALWIDQKMWALWIVCLVGNVIFWLICEYALSHAFLFRFVQGQLANIETLFGTLGTIKDPTQARNYINFETDRLKIDFVIPDQFVPIYWASIWLMLINSSASFFLLWRSFYPCQDQLFMFGWLHMAVTFPLIWKLWTYHAYKIDKFLREICKLVFVRGDLGYIDEGSLNTHLYFKFPTLPSVVALLVAMAFCLLIYGRSSPHKFVFWGLCAYFFLVPLGIVVHVLRTILTLEIPPCCFPKLQGGERSSTGCNVYRVLQGSCRRVVTLFYMIT
ncbi:MAG: hypothetical protein NTX36_04005 [Proteobacteria bacterium]|nr:hypothetical protein [Pseudomonadota bacterium]